MQLLRESEQETLIEQVHTAAQDFGASGLCVMAAMGLTTQSSAYA